MKNELMNWMIKPKSQTSLLRFQSFMQLGYESRMTLNGVFLNLSLLVARSAQLSSFLLSSEKYLTSLVSDVPS